MNKVEDLIERLIPRDAWFGASYEESIVRALRDGLQRSGDEKLQWLEEANSLFNQEIRPQAGSLPLPPIVDL